MAECELFKEERDILEEEMREVKEGGIKSFDALDGRAKTIAVEMVATDGEAGRG